ncbi:peptidase S8/S53 domain-containing protein [Lactarius quietus]|nr:peptidase S8/S53 domain-containing protein [Lactarius quietus]
MRLFSNFWSSSEASMLTCTSTFSRNLTRHTLYLVISMFFSSAEGRGIPDISAQALKIVFMFNKKPFICSGTSPSTPISASIISLLNDYLISTNRAPLGFLNPLLYGNLRQALNDITSGANPGCGTPGFSATRGWDPVTGLGTPDFLNLQALRDLMDIF